jgi:penicillin-binding protein 2
MKYTESKKKSRNHTSKYNVKNTKVNKSKYGLNDFYTRIIALIFLVLLCFGLLIFRFFWLQIYSHNDYEAKAEDNRIAILPTIPNRGAIYDRNGIELAINYPVFTLEITPSKINKELGLQKTIDAISRIINIEKKDTRRFKRLMEDSKTFESIPLRSNLNEQEIAKISVFKNQIDGVDIKSRMLRQYPLAETGAHLIGYIGRISEKDEDKIEKISIENEDSQNYSVYKTSNNYNGTTHMGKLGIEQSYEYELHGLTGNEKVEVNSSGKAVRNLSKELATPGNNITLTIDIKLQKMVEDLYGDQKGALVAIDPRNGEVLAFVSKPSFNPNLFVDGIDPENWKSLNDNNDKPLLNRALRSAYPPGSTYKPFMALAGLSMGLRTAEQAISDPGYFWFGNHKFRDDKAGGHGAVNLYKSIVFSCDTYYYMLARDIGVDGIHKFMDQLGFGKLSGIDIEGEAKGILPSKDWKIKAYKNPSQQKWYDGETISLGIGQGYNNFTMLQLARATATLANDGIVMRPHLVKNIYNTLKDKNIISNTQAIEKLNLKSEHINSVKQGMLGVNIEGTGAAAFADAPYKVAGKTGTAQVFTLNKGQKYNSNQLSKDLHDHALYMAFAPLDNPVLALALIVENAGFGAKSAAPIARKVFDYILLGKSSITTDDLYKNQPSSILPSTSELITNTATTINTNTSTSTSRNIDIEKQILPIMGEIELKQLNIEDLQKKAMSLGYKL